MFLYCTPSEVDTIQSLHTYILDRFLAIHVEHYVYAPAAGARYQFKLSQQPHGT